LRSRRERLRLKRARMGAAEAEVEVDTLAEVAVTLVVATLRWDMLPPVALGLAGLAAAVPGLGAAEQGSRGAAPITTAERIITAVVRTTTVGRTLRRGPVTCTAADTVTLADAVTSAVGRVITGIPGT